MSSERKRVVVVGGGISGLAAAYRVRVGARQRGLPLDLTLLEREARLGGRLLTIREDGLVAEDGPDAFLASKPQALALCSELDLNERLIGTNEAQRHSYIFSRGRLHDLPEGLSSLVPSRLAPLMRSRLLSPAGKARLLLDFIQPARPASGDESLGHFMCRRLEREVFEWLIEPLMGGIYAGDAQQLSLQATFPQLRQLELKHGSLPRGVMQSVPAPLKIQSTGAISATAEKRWSGFVSLRGGMQHLAEALA
jgi:oxygen-dependent protoporphyrinogen oxidase